MIPSTSPCMTAVKQSVVGSGPTLLPGKSSSRRYLRSPDQQCWISAITLAGLSLEVRGRSPDESRFSCGVLTHHQNHGLVVEVGVLVARGVEVMEGVVLLYRQQPLVVEIPQLLCHHVDVPECFRVAPKPPDGHGVEWCSSLCLGVRSRSS